MKRTLTVEAVKRIWEYDAKRQVMRWKINTPRKPIGEMAGSFQWNKYILKWENHSYEMGEIVWLLNTGKLPDSKIHYLDGNGMNWDFKNLVTENQIKAERSKRKPRPFAAIRPRSSMRLSEAQVQSIRDRYRLSPESRSGIVWKERPREHFVTLNAYNAFNGRYAHRPAGVFDPARGWIVTLLDASGKRRYPVEQIAPFLQ